MFTYTAYNHIVGSLRPCIPNYANLQMSDDFVDTAPRLTLFVRPHYTNLHRNNSDMKYDHQSKCHDLDYKLSFLQNLKNLIYLRITTLEAVLFGFRLNISNLNITSNDKCKSQKNHFNKVIIDLGLFTFV